MNTTRQETPRHLLPENCYMCGHAPHAQTPTGHAFWSNADAAAYFKAEDAKQADPYRVSLTGPAFQDAGYSS